MAAFRLRLPTAATNRVQFGKPSFTCITLQSHELQTARVTCEFGGQWASGMPWPIMPDYDSTLYTYWLRFSVAEVAGEMWLSSVSLG